MAISNNTIYSEAWKQLFNIIKNNVTNPNLVNPKFIYSAFPDSDNLDKTIYPIVTIFPITNSTTDIVTFSREVKKFNLKTTIEVYNTSSELVDNLSDSVFYAIENSESDFYGFGLKNFVLTDSDWDTVYRGKIRVHVRRYSWSFEYHWIFPSSGSVLPNYGSGNGILLMHTAERVAYSANVGTAVYDLDILSLFIWNGFTWTQVSS